MAKCLCCWFEPCSVRKPEDLNKGVDRDEGTKGHAGPHPADQEPA